MPGGDGSGPAGMGLMTGRRAGFCTGFAAPGCISPGMGYGRGRRFGRMYCFGGAFAPAVDEKEYLKNQAEFLEKQLQQIDRRLKEIKDDEK